MEGHRGLLLMAQKESDGTNGDCRVRTLSNENINNIK